MAAALRPSPCWRARWIASSGVDTYPPEHYERVRNLKYHVPMQRMGTESEVSAAIVFLLSEAAAYITGTCLRVDGGTPNARHPWKLLPASDNA